MASASTATSAARAAGKGRPRLRIDEKASDLVQNLMESYRMLSDKTVQECFNDAVYYRDEARDGFMRGQLDLRTRSQIEQIFMVIIAH